MLARTTRLICPLKRPKHLGLYPSPSWQVPSSASHFPKVLTFICRADSYLPLSVCGKIALQSSVIPLVGFGDSILLSVISILNKSFDFHFSMADVEVSDQKKCFEDSCRSACSRTWFDYQECVKRIKGDETEAKHCTGQYFDYWYCVDKCVAPKLFPKLK